MTLLAVGMALVLALTFIASQSTTVGIARNLRNHAKARHVAESGMELAIAYVRATASWRTDRTDGAWVTNEPFSSGTFTITGQDGEDTNGDGVITNPGEGDGDLADDSSDKLTLTVIGSDGVARHVIRAVLTPSQSLDILFIVPDGNNLNGQDSPKKALMESWGYSVVPFTANQSQTVYDGAVATVDVAYVSREVSSSELGTKLKSATIGIVNEVQDLTDEYGFSSANSCYTSTAVDVIDTSHYITSVFSSGALGILSSSSALHIATGTMGGGASVLAEEPSSSNASLVIIDAGGALYGGGTAAGRRVHLPWGCNGFDFALMSDDGRTVMKRALEWAGGIDGATGTTYSVAWSG